MIEVRNLTKKYGEHTAVDDLTFTVEEGRIYGFLGPNGAGKSTTMNIITGYLAATEGEVTINGYDILEDAGKAKACIGYLPEQPPLYTDMTVDEYLNFAAELKGIKKADRSSAVDRAKETVKVTDFSDKLIKNLSKGYRQRVGLAQAIIGLPEILILDEPSSGLDPKQIVEMRDLIRELGKTHTVILSSHILSEVSAICDYIMIISNGRLVASDTAENLLSMREPVTTLKMTVSGDGSLLEDIFSDISGIQNWEYDESAENIEDGYDLSINYPSENDLRRDVFTRLVKKGFIIYRMESSSVTLEDVFMELTAAESSEESALEDEPDTDDTGAEGESITEAAEYAGKEAEAEAAPKGQAEEQTDEQTDGQTDGQTDEEEGAGK